MFKNRVEEGLSGQYSGLKNGFTRINKYIYGVQRGFYTLWGGLSGSGKTTIVDFQLLNAIRDAEEKKVDLHMFYYSYEIDRVTKMCNWMSNRVYNIHREIIPPQVIAGLGEDNRLTPAQKKLVDLEIPYIEDLFEKINFRFDTNNPVGIRLELFKHAENIGKFIYQEYVTEGVTKQKIVGYKLNDPTSYTLITLDHIALVQVLKGLTLKENIDLLSSIFIWFRNICGFSFYVVQQFNQGLNSVDRMKFKGADITPQQNDFKDSTNPYTDSDIACGIMNAWKMDLTECIGYDLSILKSNFRMCKIIKNRKGSDNMTFGMYFDAQSGTFFELPAPNETTLLNKIYEHVKNKIPLNYFKLINVIK